MGRLLLTSGLLSASLWLGILVFFSVLLDWRREHRQPAGLASSSPRFSSTLLLLFLIFGATITVGYGVFKGFVAPRDLLQDIISADEFLAGRSLYPQAMNEKMSERMKAEPDLIGALPLPDPTQEQLRDQRKTGLEQKWEQAHPPLMTLLVAPFVGGGVWCTQLVMLLASLAAILLSVALLIRGLELDLSMRQRLMLVLAVLLAEPTGVALRLGQSGLILMALIILGWYALKQQRPLLAGMAIGLATSIKLFPGLLLVYLLCRHRKACIAAVGTILLLALLVGLLAGWECFGEYRETAAGIVREYGEYPGNLSLLALVSHLGGPGGTTAAELAVFAALACVIVGVAVWAVWRPREPSAKGSLLDLEYALCVALMPLLSPIAWDHFLVVLLLPLAVLGQRTLRRSAPWSETLLYLGFGTILLLPEPMFTSVWGQSRGLLWRSLVILLVWPPRTYALMFLCVWLGLLARRAVPSEPEAPRPDESGTGQEDVR